MSDTIKRVTPREIAEMIVNEQAYAATRFVLADAHDAEIARLRALVEASDVLARPGALTVNCVRGTVACQEAARLRARVEVLETALRHYADDAYNGHNTNGSCARAALEATP
jgi:hypothetical protein